MERKYTLGIMALSMVAILGIGMVSAQGFGMWGQGLTEEEKAEMEAQREAIQIAIEEDNYAEWEGLMQERLAVMEDRINEDTFNQLKEQQAKMSEFREAVETLKESGEFSREALENLREEFGIEKPEGKGFGKSKSCNRIEFKE